MDEQERNQTVGGDFSGQLAGGDILNQHHHYHESPKLTDAERWELNRKVDQVEEVSGHPAKAVWGQLNRIIGRKLADFRLAHKAPAHTILDLWIEIGGLKDELAGSAKALTRLTELNAEQASKLRNSELTIDYLKKNPPQPLELSKKLLSAEQELQSWRQRYQRQASEIEELTRSLKQAQSTRVSSHCISCNAVSHELSNTKKKLFGWMAATAIAAIAAGSLITLYRQEAAQLTAANARIQICEYGGQTYRLGSVIDLSDAPDIQCIAGDKGRVARWEKLQPTPKRRHRG
ncbi:hypothetical protein [Chromobacterium phragmitis]|uniref:hypothetical protein n=1 Tax=Chromobacterium phragmitis TaxID=2202141 RepID=UPI0011AE3573|nr:hypothetical protein [Chromobacterium phragmitis]